MSVTAMNDFVNYIVDAMLKILLRRPVKEEVSVSLAPALNLVRSGDFAELRGRHAFYPKFLIEDGMKVKEQAEGERIYLSWRELASEKFFEDVEKMFEMLQKKKRQ
jgi:hypothetical protein